MTNTFQIIRDPLDDSQWRLVTGDKLQVVWASVFCNFFDDGGSPHLIELIADNDTQAIECVILTKENYDALMA